MIKILFEQLYRLIFQPAKAWNILSEKAENTQSSLNKRQSENDSFFKDYLYPAIGIVALLSFLGILFNRKEFDVQLALKATISATLSLFVGFYLASFLLSEAMGRLFSEEKHYRRCERFAGYSSALVYVLYMFLAVFPEFSFLYLLSLYSIYMIWEGATPYMHIAEDQKVKFTVIASAIILLSPVLISKIIYMTMPGMRI